MPAVLIGRAQAAQAERLALADPGLVGGAFAGGRAELGFRDCLERLGGAGVLARSADQDSFLGSHLPRSGCPPERVNSTAQPSC